MAKISLYVVGLLLAAACANPDAPSANRLVAEVDAYLAPLVEGKEFSGVVVIANRDEFLVARAYGMADFENGRVHKIDDSFAIASLSKTFTAAAIEILANRARLNLDDTLDAYIPDFPRGEDITLEMLLLHQSGVAEEHQLPDYLARRGEPIGLSELVERIGRGPFQFEPGADGSYSNSGYIILARVVEIVSEHTFEAFLQTEIFDPAGMADTAIDRTDGMTTPSYFPGLPPSMIERAMRESHPSRQLGASELRSTAGDMIKWLRAVDGEAVFDITALAYPFGWGKREYYGRHAIEQSGITSGFISAMVMFPDEDLYIVVLSNIRAGRPQARAHIDLAGMTLGEDVAPLKRLAFDISGKIDLDRFAGRYAFPGVGPIVIRNAGAALEFEWEGFALSSYLYPLDGGLFWNKLDGAEIGFTIEGEGPATALIWSPGKEETRAARLPG